MSAVSLERFWSRVQRGGDEECWPWTGARNRQGYGVVRVGAQMLRSHRLALASTGVGIYGLCVLHRCDNPPCCNPAHLFAGTYGDNNRDTAAKGRTRSGERHPGAKLTAHAVAAIRARRAVGERGIDLAAEFGVTPAMVSAIHLRKNWSDA